MAWWDTYPAWLDRLDIVYDMHRTHYNGAYSFLVDAYECYYAADYNGALIRTINACEWMLRMWAYHIFGEYAPTEHYLLPTFFHDFYIGELTYKTICEAWGANDFEGRAVTIAFIDRMRQLLWDEPYSAIWAAKPEEEEIL